MTELDAMTRRTIVQLWELGPITARRGSDAIHLLLEDREFGLVRDGTIWFRTCEDTARAYVRAGSRALHRRYGRWIVTYHEVPPSILFDDGLACAWAYAAAMA